MPLPYIDGYVLAVPTANKDAFIEHAKIAGQVLRGYGALKVIECWGDDIHDGEPTSFPMAVDCQEDETVCFSWVMWPSKAVRDAAMPKIMNDPLMQPDRNPMPFDGNRALVGGFQMVVNL